MTPKITSQSRFQSNFGELFLYALRMWEEIENFR